MNRESENPDPDAAGHVRVTVGDDRGIGDNSDEYGDDAGLGATEDVETVVAKTARIAVLAKQQVELERDVANCEAELAKANKALFAVANRDLPLLMIDLNVAKIPLANGATVALSKKTVGSVKKEDREEFIAWLVKKGFGALPKRKIVVEFPMGAFRKAGLLLGYLRRHYKEMIFTDDESIHAGTLNAWVRETQTKNEEALRDGGKPLEFPEYLTLTDLLETTIVIPKGKQVEWN